jgi:hypothetical protein
VLALLRCAGAAASGAAGAGWLLARVVAVASGAALALLLLAASLRCAAALHLPAFAVEVFLHSTPEWAWLGAR